jgi:hypothetical protein
MSTSNQIDEAFMVIVPIKKKAGGRPKYTSVYIPLGIKKHAIAQVEHFDANTSINRIVFFK